MEEKRKPRSWLTWLVIGLVLLVAYPLSQGPVVWLSSHGKINETTCRYMDAFYLPVHLVTIRAPRVWKAYHSYLRWWIMLGR